MKPIPTFTLTIFEVLVAHLVELLAGGKPVEASALASDWGRDVDCLDATEALNVAQRIVDRGKDRVNE